MSRADEYFRQAIALIKEQGFDDSGMKVRPKWPDGEPAHTKKIFGFYARYDLSKEFPALTLRRQPFKTCVKELLWTWQRKSCDVRELGAHIWDAWADESGSIGKTYGYQLGRVYDLPQGRMDQVDALLKTLKEDPMSRRMVVTMWRPDDLKDMSLAPCAYETVWDVSGGRLNMALIQRSADALSAGAPGGYDEIQYATLLCMVARSVGLEPGEFAHFIANLHVYDRHWPAIERILANPDLEGPRLEIRQAGGFYDFREGDFALVGYDAPKAESGFEVAI